MKRRVFQFVFNVLIPALLLVVVFAIPDIHLTFDMSTLLTIVSLIFAILVGFFFAGATSNYLRLQSLVATSNAQLVAMYALAKKIQPSKARLLANRIDNYMIRELDYEFLDTDTEKEYAAILEAVDQVVPRGNAPLQLYATLHSTKEAFRASIHEVNITTKTIISAQHWLLLITLAVVIAFLTLTLRDGSLTSVLSCAAVLYAMYLSLRLLHSVDSNAFLATNLAFQDPQLVFRGIGRLPYYPEYALHRRHVKIEKPPYRVGRYLVPGSFKKKIEIVKR